MKKENAPANNQEYFNRVKSIALWASENSRFYKKKFSEIDLNRIKNFQDFETLPITTQEELHHYNFDFLAVEKNQIQHIFTSGGTKAKPKYIFYDKQSWLNYLQHAVKRWEYVGIPKNTVIGLMSNMDGLSISGPTNQRAYELMGKTCCAIGTSTPPPYIAKLIQDLEINFINSTTATMVALTSKLKEQGINPKKFGVKKICVGGEVLTEQNKKYLQENWGAEIFNKFGATETGLFGGECKKHCGTHVIDEMVYCELVDPKTKKPTKREGELIVTTLLNKAMPLIRYSTGDIAKLTRKKCGCGRKTTRIWVKGRISDTIFMQDAVKLAPFQINEALDKTIPCHYEYTVKGQRKNSVDKINFLIELPKEHQSEELKNKIKKALENSSLPIARGVQKGIHAFNIAFVNENSLKRTDRGKIKDRISWTKV